MEKAGKVLLIIMDGWGLAEPGPGNAISLAHTPFYDALPSKAVSQSHLITSGLAVGLPPGQMGNSEVGHMTIGAGRIIYQELVRINTAIENDSLANNAALQTALTYARENNKPFHLLGLLSDGGVHSHINHLFYLLQAAQKASVQKIVVWPFLDGRDTDPHAGLGYLKQLEAVCETTGAHLGGLIGRYYAMDRDKRWERVKRAYDLLVNGIGHPTHSVEEAVRNAYKKDISDEFMEPFLMHDENNLPVASINEGDAVLFFNFRTDRGRELTTALTQQAFPEQNMRPLSLHFTTLTEYDPTYKNIFVMLSQQTIENGLGQVIANQGIAQIRSAETEKYPHVTFFFNGQNEVPNEKEERIMVPSPKVATYDLQPEMSAIQLADAFQPKIEEGAAGFICVNFANPDMVGHTGIIPAVVKALETVDACVQRLTETALAAGYEVLITADHGNAEFMLNPDGTPNTAHTTNPVPLFYVSNHPKGKLHEGGLADLAPTILQLMNIEVPNEMTGKSLLA